MIYLDNSATTFPKPECLYSSVDNANRNLAFNAGRSSYNMSKKAFEVLNESRKIIASFINTCPTNIVFTSSATEAINMLVTGLNFSEGDNVYITVFEHNAIVRPLYALKNINIHFIPFGEESWSLKEEDLRNMFAIHKPKAVFISHISNVTGFELPYKTIFELSAKFNAINVLDCAQSYGVLIPHCEYINYLIFAGHKSLYSSFGVGGFIKLKPDILKPMKFGGTGSDSLNLYMPDELPQRYEAGSNNVVAIAGLLSSAQWVKKNNIAEHEYMLTNYLLMQLKKIKEIKIFLPDNIKSLGIVSIAISGYNADDVALILSEEFDICVRSGYHCAPFIHKFIGSEFHKGTVRISVGAFNTLKDIDYFIDAIKKII